MRICRSCNIRYVDDGWNLCARCGKVTGIVRGAAGKAWIDKVEEAIHHALQPATNAQLEDEAMPKGTKVERAYTKLRGKGMSAGKAARIAQAATGQSLQTGKPPKKKR